MKEKIIEKIIRHVFERGAEYRQKFSSIGETMDEFDEGIEAKIHKEVAKILEELHPYQDLVIGTDYEGHIEEEIFHSDSN